MALFQCKIFSKSLFRNINVNVTLPVPDSSDYFLNKTTPFPTSEKEKYQVLWLLHGFIADESDWQRFSSIERYAQSKFVAVIMPDAYNSMYSNDHFGAAYYDFYTKELPEIMRYIFPVSRKRENNFIAGLSMGGYGAFKAALRNPSSYAAAASLSGGLNLKKEENADLGISRYSNVWKRSVFGEHMEYWDENKDNLKTILKNQMEREVDLPRLYQCCGTEDFLYKDNIDFRDYARNLNVDLTYEEGPGVHDFDFWDPYIRKVLEWLPLKGKLVD